MLLVATVASGVRSTLPAVTHVDGSARVQTVSARWNPRFHELLSRFERRTGSAVLVNTSFNVRGEPIVCTPEDAYRCFMKTGMDHLVLGGRLLHKAEQPSLREPPAAAAASHGSGAPCGRLARVARFLPPLCRAWMRIGAVLGWVNARLVFGAVYLLVLIPYGIAFRLLGRHPLDLRFDSELVSYRKGVKESSPAAMNRPY